MPDQDDDQTQDLSSSPSGEDKSTAKNNRYKALLQGLGGAAAGYYNNMGPNGRPNGPQINPAAVGQGIGGLMTPGVGNAPVPAATGAAPMIPQSAPVPPAVPAAPAAQAAQPMQNPQPFAPSPTMAQGGTTVGMQMPPRPAPQAIFDSSWTRTPPNPALPTMADGGAAYGSFANTPMGQAAAGVAPTATGGQQPASQSPALPRYGMGGQQGGQGSPYGSFGDGGGGSGASRGWGGPQEGPQGGAWGGAGQGQWGGQGGGQPQGSQFNPGAYGASPVQGQWSGGGGQVGGVPQGGGLPGLGTSQSRSGQQAYQGPLNPNGPTMLNGGGGLPSGSQSQMAGFQPLQSGAINGGPVQPPAQRYNPVGAQARPGMMGGQSQQGQMFQPSTQSYGFGGNIPNSGGAGGPVGTGAQSDIVSSQGTGTYASPSLAGQGGYGSQPGMPPRNGFDPNQGSPRGAMARGGVIDGGIPGLEPPKAEAGMRRYSPIGPRNPAAMMTPAPTNMAHHLPQRETLKPKINVKLPKPKIPGPTAIK